MTPRLRRDEPGYTPTKPVPAKRKNIKIVPMPDIPPGKIYTITEAATELKMSPQYIRTLIRNKVITTYKEPLGLESAGFRHVIHESELLKYETNVVRKSKRTDGRTKYIFYANDGEFERMVTLVKSSNLAHLAEFFRTANPLKPKE